jgi:hypothetical protein
MYSDALRCGACARRLSGVDVESGIFGHAPGLRCAHRMEKSVLVMRPARPYGQPEVQLPRLEEGSGEALRDRTTGLDCVKSASADPGGRGDWCQYLIGEFIDEQRYKTVGRVAMAGLVPLPRCKNSRPDCRVQDLASIHRPIPVARFRLDSCTRSFAR